MERALTLLLVLVVEPLLGLEQRFAMEPQDQTAIVGSRVTLPCRVINKTGVLQWTKDDFGLGTHRNLSGFDRYAMIGSDEEGQSINSFIPKSLSRNASHQQPRNKQISLFCLYLSVSFDGPLPNNSPSYFVA
ncbi:Irregular chiasm C-roughest protein [Blattella germanica]|nr:Irregular chiasm C-roughest protein [Blattella germanica]